MESDDKFLAILVGIFKIITSDGDKVTAQCMKCQSKKIYSGLLSAATNFLYCCHLVCYVQGSKTKLVHVAL